MGRDILVVGSGEEHIGFVMKPAEGHEPPGDRRLVTYFETQRRFAVDKFAEL